MDLKADEITNNKTQKEKVPNKKKYDDLKQLIYKKVDNFETIPSEKQKKVEIRKLKKKLVEIADRNKILIKSLNDKNIEISNLRRSVKSLNDVINSVPINELRCNSSIASNKILDFCKKNRQLRVELEMTKNRIEKKETQIQNLEHELKKSEETFKHGMDMVRNGNCNSVEDVLNRLHNLQQKFFETRNKNVEYQNQLKLARKCLQREVADLETIKSLTEESSGHHGWRGRAQQIVALQQKVVEFKTRLEVYERTTSANLSSTHIVQRPSTTLCMAKIGNIMTTNKLKSRPIQSTSGTPMAAEYRQRKCSIARKSESNQLNKIEILEQEINNLRTILEEQHNKVAALKTRNKTLNQDIFNCKMEYNSLEKQSDTINLSSINEKLNRQKENFETNLEKTLKEISDAMTQRQAAERKTNELKTKFEEMSKVVNNKDECVNELNDIIVKLDQDLKALFNGFLFACKELRKDEFITILNSLETTKIDKIQRIRILHTRINDERNKNNNFMEQILKQKIRLNQSEIKIFEFGREYDAQIERKKRTQCVSEYTNNRSPSTVQSGIVSTGSFIFENSSTSLNSAVHNYSVCPEDDVKQKENLQNQYEIASEKIIMLEEKIKHLHEEKENNLNSFEEIITNSKDIMVEALLTRRALNKNDINPGSMQCFK